MIRDSLLVRQRHGGDVEHRRVARSSVRLLDRVDHITKPEDLHTKVQARAGDRQLWCKRCDEDGQSVTDLISRLDPRHRGHRLVQPQMRVRLVVELLSSSHVTARERGALEVDLPVLGEQTVLRCGRLESKEGSEHHVGVREPHVREDLESSLRRTSV